MKLGDVIGLVTGWKGYAAAAGVAFLAGGYCGWEARDLFADRAERDRLIQANASLQEQLDRKELQMVANAEAIADAEEARRRAEQALKNYLEKMKNVDPNGDCLPSADRQPLVDELR